jgi:hypothetical protein
MSGATAPDSPQNKYVVYEDTRCSKWLNNNLHVI